MGGHRQFGQANGTGKNVPSRLRNTVFLAFRTVSYRTDTTMSKRASRRKSSLPPRRPVVRLDRDLGKAKEQAEVRKTEAETTKIGAETTKLHAETKKINTDRWVNAIGAVTAFLLALGGARWLWAP